jgi:hypothetical protein
LPNITNLARIFGLAVKAVKAWISVLEADLPPSNWSDGTVVIGAVPYVMAGLLFQRVGREIRS